MNLWQLVGPNKIERREQPLPESREDKIRVRISKVFVNDTDAALAAGAVRAKLPLVPGRYAVGIVTEETANPLFPKGTHVVPHTYRPIPDTGTEKRDFSEEEYLVCGKTADGFLSDFVMLSPDEMTPLPVSVSDAKALFLHQVAVAKAAVDRLEPKKGQHVAVVGANPVGILAAELLIYQQAAPILVDADESRLAFARRCGVYYTELADEDAVGRIASVTGGRLAGGAICVVGSEENDPSLAFSVCARDANVVMCSAGLRKVVVDLETAMRRHLAVHCVTGSADYLEAAINLIANKAVDLDNFRIVTEKAAAAERNFVKFAAGVRQDVSVASVYDLL